MEVLLCVCFSETEDDADGVRDAAPIVAFFGEFFAAEGSELVEAGAAVVFADAPFGLDPAVLLHAMEGGIEGTFFDAEDVVGDALDVQGDSPAMHGLALQALQDEESE
jgi:hypothetical protein